MKRTILAIGLLLMLMIAPLAAQEGAPAKPTTPQEVVRAAFDAQNEFDWERYTSYQHPDGLEQYKAILWPTVEAKFADPNASVSQVQLLLGVGVGPDGKLPDYAAADFFSNSLLQIMEAIPQFKQQIGSGETTVIGSVKENEELVHVVVRVTYSQMGQSVSQVKVATVKPFEGEWKMMLMPEMIGLANGVAQLLNQ